MKKCMICLCVVITCIGLKVKDTNALEPEYIGKNKCYTSGYYYLNIVGPYGTQKIKINLSQPQTNYSTLISKSISVSVSSQNLTSNLYSVSIPNQVVSTLLDDKNNYTVVMIYGSYVQPPHAIRTKISYDKANLPARMYFNEYKQIHGYEGNSTLPVVHDSNARTIGFGMQVNLAQASIKTVDAYRVSGATMQFEMGYSTYNIYFDNGVSSMATTCGSTVTSLPSTSRNYYNFNGWYLNGNKVNSVYVCGSDLSLNASFTPTTYHITYNLDGGNASNPTSYHCEQGFTLNNPTKKKYEFIGWSGSGISSTQKVVNVGYGSGGDLSFTAHYKRIYTPPTLNAYDRYVFVGQTLTKQNLLNSVTSYDEDDMDISNLVIIESIDYNDYLDTEVSKIDTSKPGVYKINLKVTDKINLTTKRTIKLYIIEDTTSYIKTNYRFIKHKYIYTLNDKSTWKNAGNNEKLIESLNRTSPLNTYKL